MVVGVSPKHGLGIFPGKGTFHPGRAPGLRSGSVLSAREPWETWGGASPHTEWRNWPGLTKDLMMPTCWTKEGKEIKGGVVTFQGDLVSHSKAM